MTGSRAGSSRSRSRSARRSRWGATKMLSSAGASEASDRGQVRDSSTRCSQGSVQSSSRFSPVPETPYVRPTPTCQNWEWRITWAWSARSLMDEGDLVRPAIHGGPPKLDGVILPEVDRVDGVRAGRLVQDETPAAGTGVAVAHLRSLVAGPAGEPWILDFSAAAPRPVRSQSAGHS